MQTKIRVLIIDDSLTIRAMISSVLENDPSIRVVGVAANADEADEMIDRLLPDVVTLDIEMPGVNGFDYLLKLKTWLKKPVIMLSSRLAKDTEARLEAAADGAAGCFDKALAIKEARNLVKMIKDAAHGKLKPEPLICRIRLQPDLAPNTPVRSG